MKKKLTSLINIRKFRKLLDSFCLISGIPVTVIDNEGVVVVASGIQDYNLNYIRAQNIYNRNGEIFTLKEAGYFKNPFGLSDYAIPIKLEEVIYGVIIIGYMYFEKPDIKKLEKYAGLWGFNEQALSASLLKVPVISGSDFEHILSFVDQFKDYVVEKIIERNRRLQTEKHLKKAQEIAHVGNWEIDLKTRKTHWSQEVSRIFGINIKKAFYSQKELFDVVHPEDRQWLFELYQNSNKTSSSSNCSYRIIRQDNSLVRWVHHKWEFQKDKDGLPVKMFGIVQDITEYKEAEEARNISEERFRHVTDNAGVWVWEINSEGLYTYSSPVIEKILGYTMEELVGKMFVTELSAPSLKDEHRELAKKIFNSGKPFRNFLKPSLHKNGSIVMLVSSGTPVYDKLGKLVGYRGTDIDFTGQKKAENELIKSEEKFKAIFENSGIGIFLTNLDGRIINSNPALQKMLGYSSAELAEMLIIDITHKDDLSIDWNLFIRIALGSRERYLVERRFVTKEKNILWVQLTISPVRDETGDLQFAVGMVENISDRKKADEEIKKMNKELMELNATKDKFFSIIAHDLKSPFHGMIGLSEMLIDPLIYLTESERKRRLSILHSAIVKQYELLQNLLGWAQLQLGNITFNPVEIYLDEFSREVVSSLYANAEKKNIVILNEIDSKTIVFADVNMLRSILQNFIINSVKFTNNNGHVRIFSEKEGNFINIFIEDNGVGLKKENIIKILTPKYHFTTNGTNGEQGTGLGVLLCREMIEKHGGQLKISSEPGKGTIVEFSIPAVPDVLGINNSK